MTKQYEFIAEHVPGEAVLCQIAEEAAELAQAAMKLLRAETGINPTPVSTATALYNILEEFADVHVAENVFMANFDTDMKRNYQSRIDAIIDEKTERWAQRIKESESND